MNQFPTFKNYLEKVKNIEGYLVPGQEKGLMVLASQVPKNGVIVEIGSFKGKSTACLALASNDSTKVYAIDTFEGNSKDFSEGVQFLGGNFYADFLRNIKTTGKAKKVHTVNGLSSKIGEKWNKKIDFLFIDGSHIYEDVKLDFDLFYPWVKEGGIIAFHDVHPNFPGVSRVWKESKEKLIAYSNIHTLYYGIKPKKGLNKESAQKIIEEIDDKIKLNKVFIVIPVFNRLDSTIKCLNSLKNQNYKNFEVIVIDDGSTDGTFKYISKNYPNINLIKSPGNWWWTKSIYKGVEKALSIAEENDFILTMNNDCYFGSNYIKNIVYTSLKNKRAVTGSLILSSDNHKEVIDAGVMINWKNAIIFGVADKVSNDLKFYTDRKIITDLDTLPGKGTLIPVEVFSKVGNFNYKRLPHYIGDYEFFCRSKQKGFKLIISSSARLYNFAHLTGASHFPLHKSNYKQVLEVLFGRKSKINIVDHINFLLLCCPKKYLWNNFKQVFHKLITYSLMVFPFYYIKVFIHIFNKTKYWLRINLHNLPIKIRQNKVVSRILLFLHNLPIYLRQNITTKRLIKIIRRFG